MKKYDYRQAVKDSIYDYIIENEIDLSQRVGANRKMYVREVTEVRKLKDIDKINNHFRESEYIAKSYISEVDPSTGEVTINLEAPSGLYSKVLNDIMGISVSSKAELLALFQELNIARKEYNQIKTFIMLEKF